MHSTERFTHRQWSRWAQHVKRGVMLLTSQPYHKTN